MTTLSLSAPAKVNLFLHVLGKRVDGYHDLITWMQKIDLCDQIELTLTDTSDIKFTCSDAEVPADKNNLAVRAAELFLKRSNKLAGAGLQMHLEKNIPVAAGLGGGSSDAGTVLQGLNQIAGGEVSENELMEMAVTLGADVPFFAVNYNAVLAEGIGEIMTPVSSLEDYSFILINPDFFLSTAWVFGKLSLTNEKITSKVPRFQKQKGVSLSLADLHNDLENVSCKAYPQIDEMKKSLLEAGATQVLMSGSGPTVFGVFPDPEKSIGSDLQRIVGELRQEYGKKVFLARACTGA